MAIIYQKIVIVKSRKPSNNDINEEIRWFCDSLGLFNLRDKDSSCYRIFIELLRALKTKNAMSSDRIASNLNLSRGTVVHHLNKLMDAGIVVSERKRYLLRVDNLEVLVEEIEKDVKRACDDLRRVAENIDKELNL
ncbi:MAG: ArsR family transcriptional regulator [bacterium]|nr:ArsR family transcriptional regulator [bacterium]